MKSTIVCLLLAAALAPALAHAIVVRDDRDDARYRELAPEHENVCRAGGGMGTLIAPEWVLTAAHVAEGLAPGDVVRFGEREVTIVERFVHPDFALADRHRDLGLLRLEEPVTSIKPAALYRALDEQQQLVTLVGAGQTGNGRTGPTPGAHTMRAAHNRIEHATTGWLSFTFDTPPDGEDLEGISGPGDSGGPAFISTDQGWAVAGVSAYNDGSPPCTYGTTEHYSRVSDELEWIEGVMDGRIGRAAQPRMMNYGTNKDGVGTVTREPVKTVELGTVDNTALWDTVEALTASINEGDRSRYLSLFTTDYVERQARAGDPVDSMFDFIRGSCEVFGPIRTFHPVPPDAVQIPDSQWPMRAVTFHMETGRPGYMGIALASDGRIDHLSLFVQRGICEAQGACTAQVELSKARG